MELEPRLRKELERVAQCVLGHSEAGTMALVDGVMEVEAAQYCDPSIFELEVKQIFRCVPQMLALSCELVKPGSYKTLEVAGIPILVTRGKDGQARAMLNACAHRGTTVAQGCGSRARLTCPFHGWSYGLDGRLLAIASAGDFGDVDKASLGLRQFPTVEKAGMIWAILDPDSTLDIAGFLGDFGEMLEAFEFRDWHLLTTRSLKGPNWKLAYDAHFDWYHLPVLHRESFGPTTSNRALFEYYGPHLRMARPAPDPEPQQAPAQVNMYVLKETVRAEQWPIEALMMGGWLAFPNLSLYTLYHEGRRLVILNQIIPGPRVDQSLTVQHLIAQDEPDERMRQSIENVADFHARVAREEDLPVSAQQQQAAETGLLPTFRFGRNEGGNQHFHKWVQRIVNEPDEGPPALLNDKVLEAEIS